MTLLLSPINGMAGNNGIGGPAQVTLKKGSTAPIDGVLVPYDLFREYEINELEGDMVRKELSECERTSKSVGPESSFLSPLWFVGGFFVGALATGALR